MRINTPIALKNCKICQLENFIMRIQFAQFEPPFLHLFKAVGGGREVKNWSFSVSTYVIEDSIGNPNFFTESKKNARKKSYRHKRLKKSSKN